MTLAEARALQPGDYVASAHDVPEWIVRRVTDRWTSVSGQFVRVKLASYQNGEWIDPARFVRVPRMRTKDFPYRNGDTLQPEHRGLAREVQGVKEAETT